jgi:hypothetical protein
MIFPCVSFVMDPSLKFINSNLYPSLISSSIDDNTESKFSFQSCNERFIYGQALSIYLMMKMIGKILKQNPFLKLNSLIRREVENLQKK